MATITLNKLAYNLLETVRQRVVDDDVIDIRQIKSAIHAARAVLIKQAIDKRGWAVLRDSWLQQLRPTTGVKMISVDASQITSLTSEQYVRRSELQIPQPLFAKNGLPLFYRVGPVNKLTLPYQIVSHNRALNTGVNRFTKDYINVCYLNNYIYLFSGSQEHLLVEYIDVVGIFQNPSEIYMFNDVNGDSMDADAELNYPIDLELEIPIRQLVFEKFLGIKAKSTTDIINNAEHEQTQI